LNAEELSNNREKSHSVSEEIVSGLLQVADIDGDGQISQSEFARVADTIESHISEVNRFKLSKSSMGA
jgi:Ca2+-binding EF-hand superfamily protein